MPLPSCLSRTGNTTPTACNIPRPETAGQAAQENPGHDGRDHDERLRFFEPYSRKTMTKLLARVNMTDAKTTKTISVNPPVPVKGH